MPCNLDSGRIYNHILLVSGKQRKGIVIKPEWSCGKGALKPVSLSCADSCLMLGHSGCLLHAPKQKFLPPDGRFNWLITTRFFKFQKWKAGSKLSAVTTGTVHSPVGFKWDSWSLHLFIWLFWTHPELWLPSKDLIKWLMDISSCFLLSVVVMAAWTPQGGRAGMGLLRDLLYNIKMHSYIMLLPCNYLMWYGLEKHL